MSKYFVIDTNVLIHNPAAIYSFSEHTVVIPIFVVEELDRLKTSSDKKGMHARTVLRELDRYVHKGAIKQGVKLSSGGRLMIPLSSDFDADFELDLSVTDNRILWVAVQLQRQGENVFFVSKDVNARIKAEALGVHSQDYERQRVEYQSMYKGWRDISLSADDVAQLSESHELRIDADFQPNECTRVTLETSKSVSLLARYDATSKSLVQIRGAQDAFGIRPLNLEQRFAYELLMDDRVQLVSLVGPAGTGKTLFALACALEKILGQSPRYEKLLVARPIMPLGKDIGYLPGTKDQKLNYWMQPIFDNVNFLLNQKDHFADKGIKRSRREDKVDYLMDAGLIEIEAITYIRGRSIPNQFIIIDEAQNLTPHEIKTIISRAGEGTKIVLTGDPEQIDNPYLDSNTNGLTYTAERLKTFGITGQMFLSKSERSQLAAVAAENL